MNSIENAMVDSWEDNELLDYDILSTETDIPGAFLEGSVQKS